MPTEPFGASGQAEETELGVVAFPASFAQNRLWLIEQGETYPGLYNVPVALRLSGVLDVIALERAINEIVARHEALRTTFRQVGGQLMQLITPASSVRLEIHDLSALTTEEARDRELERCKREAAERLFDLKIGPLFHVQLLRLHVEEHLLLLVMHHIITDGWSMSVFFHELSVLYEAFLRGDASPLAELPIQYADYSEWQREWLHGVTLDEQLDYWKTQLGDTESIIELPVSNASRTGLTHRGAHETLLLSEDLRKDLNQMATQEGVTLFMLLLAAWQALLFRYTDHREVCVGTAIANRNSVELEGLIGFFVNTLVLKAEVDGRQTFRELLEQVREITVGAYAHQDLPFEKLVEALRPDRSSGHTPLFQVMFALQNTPPLAITLSGLKLQFVPIMTGNAKFDLSLFAREVSGGLKLVIEYKTDLFESAMIRQMLEHYRALLKGIINEPAGRVSDFPLLNETEQQKVLVDWNDTAGEYPSGVCLQHVFEAQVERSPDAVAVTSGDVQVSYQELNRAANRMAHYLRKRGVGPEIRVGILLERNASLLSSQLSVLKAGGVCVPINLKYKHDREALAYIFKDSGISLLLTQSELGVAAGLTWPPVINVDIEAGEIAGERSENLESEVISENLAFIVYPSESTDRPAGVMIEHRGLCNLAAAGRRILGLQVESRVLYSTSSSSVASIFQMVTAWSSGASLCAAESESDQNLISLMQDRQVTMAILPSSILTRLPEAELPFLKVLAAVGDACPPEIGSRWGRNRRFFNFYGTTETTMLSIAAVCAGEKKPLIGRPVLNTHAYVVDSNLRPVPIGVAGELCIAGLGLARGYVNQPMLTADRFIPNPFSAAPGDRLYRTGSRVRYLANSQLEFLGRVDHRKIKSLRVEPDEIATLLMLHPAVREAYVIDRAGTNGERRLVSYVVERDGAIADAYELRKYMAKHVSAYKIPAAFVRLDTLPLTHDGRVDTNSLPEPRWNGVETGRVYIPPRNFKEQVLIEMWEDLLGVKGISAQDNFFELGGNSLLMMQVIGSIHRVFDVDLPLATFYESPTVEAVAELIRQLQKSTLVEEALTSLKNVSDKSTKSPLVILSRDGSTLPFFCFHTAGGHLGEHRELARELGSYGQPVYGLQARGLDDDAESDFNIEAMAASYIEAILRLQPHGPFRLGGYCSGGLIALESAQQLQRLGHEVSTLALICSSVTWFGSESTEKVAADVLAPLQFCGELKIKASAEQLRAVPPSERMNKVWDEFCNQSPTNAFRLGTKLFGRLYKTYVANLEALIGYVPQPYNGFIASFEATEHRQHLQHDSGWEKLSQGRFERHEIPGNHITLMRQPHVKVLAHKLNHCLNEERKMLIKRGARSKTQSR
ncbi:MAG TPA: condensation domain-containing protein [Pyrinomonadaceae bacterium]